MKTATKRTAGLLAVLFVTAALVFGAVGEQTLVLRATDLENYNPFLLQGRNDDINVAAQIWDTLVFSSADDFSAQRELAMSWETPDDLTWIFHLRPGVYFQDGNELFAEGAGREVVADDVVASIGYAKKYGSAKLDAVVSVVALDKYTVEITTDVPQPLLLTGHRYINGVFIVPPEAVTESEDTIEVLPIGSGPFELQSFLPAEEAILTANEDYWLPVALDEVRFVVISDASAAVIALEAGQVDVLPFAPADEAPRLVEEGFTLLTRGGSFRGVGFNVTAPPFDDYNVREGISLILDIDSAWEAVVPEGLGIRAYGQVPPWVPMGYDESLADLDKFDVVAGLAMLADAGWEDTDGDGWLDKDGAKLSFEMKCFSGDQVRTLTILATQLQSAGIEATVLQMDVGVWVDDLLAGNSTVFFDFSYAGDTGLYSMFRTGQDNPHQYSNPEVDRLIDEALATIDFDARSALWKAAQRLIVADRAIIPMYFGGTPAIIGPYVNNYVIAWSGGLQLVSIENTVYLDDQ